MIKKFTLISFLSLCFFIPVFSQSVNAVWEMIGFDVAGHNIQNGVEAYYQLNKCNGEDVVYVKFINHNNYPVMIQWTDAVFTQDLKWVNGSSQKNISLAASQQKEGNCSGSDASLSVSLKNFISDISNFKRYGANSFSVTQQ